MISTVFLVSRSPGHATRNQIQTAAHDATGTITPLTHTHAVTAVRAVRPSATRHPRGAGHACRLIQQQQRRRVGQRARDRHPLLFSTWRHPTRARKTLASPFSIPTASHVRMQRRGCARPCQWRVLHLHLKVLGSDNQPDTGPRRTRELRRQVRHPVLQANLRQQLLRASLPLLR